jgi:hypothetical protein
MEEKYFYPRGEWKPLPHGAIYVSPIRGFERFVGTRPKSRCNLYDSAQKCLQDRTCLWVPSQHYCRGNPGSVSGGYTSQVWYEPPHLAGFSECAHRTPEDCKRHPHCVWKNWFTETGEGSGYCSGFSLSTHPYSIKFVKKHT